MSFRTFATLALLIAWGLITLILNAAARGASFFDGSGPPTLILLALLLGLWWRPLRNLVALCALKPVGK